MKNKTNFLFLPIELIFIIFKFLNKSTQIKLFNEIFFKFNFQVFFNKQEFFNYFVKIEKTSEILKYLKLSNITRKLSNNDFYFILLSFNSSSCYKTFEYLFEKIKLNDNISYRLMKIVLFKLRTPTTTKQQNIQLEIMKKLINYESVKRNIKTLFFEDVVYSFNIPLVDFCIKELNILNNYYQIFHSKYIVQWVVDYLTKNPIDVEFSYEMFDFLLTIGTDIKKRDEGIFDIHFYIDIIKDENIKNKLNEMLLKRITNNV